MDQTTDDSSNLGGFELDRMEIFFFNGKGTGSNCTRVSFVGEKTFSYSSCMKDEPVNATECRKLNNECLLASIDYRLSPYLRLGLDV